MKTFHILPRDLRDLIHTFPRKIPALWTPALGCLLSGDSFQYTYLCERSIHPFLKTADLRCFVRFIQSSRQMVHT